MAFELENMDSSITKIPEEIKKEILVRLPLKSLARFRCVSKTWLFMISSITKEQLRISWRKKNNDRLIFGSKNQPMEFSTSSIQSLLVHEDSNSQIYPTTKDNNNLLFDRARVDKHNYPFSEKDGQIQIVGSCNGLVCLISYPANTFVLWNPTTGKLRKLPGSGTPNSDPQSNRYFFSSYAFGYDEPHDDYKVVESCHAMENLRFVPGGLGLKVYSLRTNSWKTLSNWPTAAAAGHIHGGMGKFLNGAIHWIVRYFGDSEVKNRAMVSHDLATDTFSVSRVPEIGGGGGYLYAVTVDVLQGQLALYVNCFSHMDVWVMKEYGVYESWTKSFRITKRLGESIRPAPLFYWPEKGKVLIDYRTNLGIFDLNSQRPHQLGEVSFHVECTTYFESLVSPNLDNDLVLGRAMPPVFFN